MEVASFEAPADVGSFKLPRTSLFLTVDPINASNPVIRWCDAYVHEDTRVILPSQPGRVPSAMYAPCVCFQALICSEDERDGGQLVGAAVL